ncbi:MAG: cupin domain-containing protein [Candidatus Njordarchaeales archaeon]
MPREVIKKADEVPMQEVDFEGAIGAYIQWLLSKDDGAENFAMRRFTIKPGGKIPRHAHWYEHEIYVLKGRGRVGIGEKVYEVEEGSVLFVPPDVPHWYENIGDEDWVFLCIIPLRKPE